MSTKPARDASPKRFATLCVQSPAVDSTEATPPVSPPLHHASAFETPTLETVARALDGEPGLYSYGRTANPTVAAFEVAVARLEGAEAACAAASGMGALAATLLGIVRPGELVVTASDLYGTTSRMLDHLGTLGYRVVPLVGGVLPEGARLVLAEVITNPLLGVTDVAELAGAAHSAGALLLVDSTFATPYHCQPLSLGADLVVHSATKYLGGHGDLLAGVVAGRTELVDQARAAMQRFGAPLAPTAAWLGLRGLRTLALRMERQSANAALVAEHLAGHRSVARVFYPGLRTHPSHAAALRTLERGFGAMVSFELASPGPGNGAAEAFVGRLDTIRFVASLGDVATTVSHPGTTSHRSLSTAARLAQGISDATLRLSVGAEAVDDIIDDLDRGLNGA